MLGGMAIQTSAFQRTRQVLTNTGVVSWHGHYTNSLMGTPVASPMELAILIGRPTGVM